ncbi:hypothetical protein EU528_14340 [Candidatus Thorarchaeota archaeon]|nr:MAG: hypothetical protein EU528_14340 [Candidatus Thorarchaeota archaeon]
MSAESTNVVWPEVCVGCGEKRIRMEDASFKWRSTEPVGSERGISGPMISFKVEVQLCEECADESKILRKANTSWKLTIWLMKFFFFLLIPTILIVISTELVPSTLGVEYAIYPAGLAVIYPYIAVFVTFHDARMTYLTRSIPASAFITINPRRWREDTISFSLRNKDYALLFHQLNPTLKSSHTPSISGDIEYPKKFPKNKAIAIISPSLVAIVLILLLVMGFQ